MSIDPTRAHRSMSDRATVGMAAAALAGAWLATPLPRSLAVALCVVGLGLRRSVVLIVGVAVAASSFGARAEAGLVWTEPSRHVGFVTLVGDPAVVNGAVRVGVRLDGPSVDGRLDAQGDGQVNGQVNGQGDGQVNERLRETAGPVDERIDGRRVEAWARGPAGRALAQRLSGERVMVTGWVRPLPTAVRARLASRHVAGRMTIMGITGWAPGDPLSRAANGLRRLLLSGARSLPSDQLGLFGGFVLGDDRGQPVDVVEDFRAAGLSHLLVVSGQNVVFVLALAAPFLRRLGLGSRLAAALALLVLFGVLTRWEPSVLRAVAMAAISFLASTLGRPVSRLRVLALAVAGLVLVDPLLVRSVGFALSAGACAGIVLLAGPLARAIPGPRWLAEAGAVTLAAQAGVAPILVPIFGGMPVASLPANLLAVPAAGVLMMWGMSAGVVAGAVGDPLASAIHLPTRLLIGWIAGVARVAGAWPLGQVRSGHLALAAVPVAAAAVARTLVLLRHRHVPADSGTVASLQRLSSPAAAPPPDGSPSVGPPAVGPPAGPPAGGWPAVGPPAGGSFPWKRVRVATSAVALVLLPVGQARWPPGAGGVEVVEGARLWRAGSAVVLVLDGVAGSPGRLLGELRAASVRRLDVVVLARSGSRDARALAPLLRRMTPRLVLAGPGSGIADVVVAPVGSRTDAGLLSVWVDRVDPHLVVRVGLRS